MAGPSRRAPDRICPSCHRVVDAYCSFCGVVCQKPPWNMVPVPAGPILLGTTEEQREMLSDLGCDLPKELITREAPQLVCLPASFYIDRYPVTRGQFAKFAERLGTSRLAALGMAGLGPVGDPELPVTGVTWRAAAAYAEKEGKRLPTEAEWEKAAGFDPMTPKKRIFPWGNEDDQGMRNRGTDLASIHAYKAGMSALGCCDLAGNAQEWCADPFEEVYRFHVYEVLRTRAPAERHTVRGGTFERTALECRVAYRAGMPADAPAPFTGFRCVLDVKLTPRPDPLSHPWNSLPNQH